MAAYTPDQIAALAAIAAADYAAACDGPVIRGRNGESNLRGTSLEEVAEKNGLFIELAAALTVDLSVAAVEDLPSYWQQVNIRSAESMIALMEAMGGEDVVAGLDLDDPKVRAEYGALLHQLWLEQPCNDWAKGGELDRPFSLLDPVEQEKDIQQLLSLQRWLRSLTC